MIEHHSSWIFPWRRRFQRRWHLFFATLIVSIAATVVFSTMRVRVFPSPPPSSKQAELLLLTNEPSNRDLLVRLSQKTPFPINLPNTEIELIAAPHLHEAGLTELIASSKLKDIVVPRTITAFVAPFVLPAIDSVAIPNQKVHRPFMPQPRVRLMSIQDAPAPISWPIFVLTSQPPSEQRFMIHIAENGFVDQCQPMGAPAVNPLNGIESWLLSLRYSPEKNQPRGWHICEIDWMNVAP